jgi:hypothetical protein
MSVGIGVIRGGRLVLQDEGGEPLPEGRKFTVVIDEDDHGPSLDEESVKLLLEAQAKIRRGERIAADDALKQIDEA